MSQFTAAKNKKLRFVTSFGENTLKQHGTVVSYNNEVNCGLKPTNAVDDVIDLGEFINLQMIPDSN